MGQQQLLLIVLGVIIVGVAVVLGIQYFSVGAEDAAKDELVAHTLMVGANAQQWFKKPVAMGGGGNTFVGYTQHWADADLDVSLGTSTNGTYEPTGEGATSITIIGSPVLTEYNWHVQTTVTAETIEAEINTGAAP